MLTKLGQQDGIGDVQNGRTVENDEIIDLSVVGQQTLRSVR